MSAADLPIPPEVFYDEAPPLSDDELERMFSAVDNIAFDGKFMLAEAFDVLADVEVDQPSYPAAQATARWQVNDDRTAAWAATKLAAAEGEVARLTAQRDEWMERIGVWFDQASRKPRRTAEFMRGQLERYGLAVREETGQATLALPDATVRTTHHKARLEVTDDEVLADWLDHHATDWKERFYPDGVFDEEAWEKLVRRTAKVYVGEARKVLRIVEVGDGARGTVLMDCGHRDSAYRALEGEEFDMPDVGDVHVCFECDPTGKPVLVEGSFVEKRTIPVVVGVTDEVVPGATVRSAETTATVEVNL